jgi:nucleotide-binding universal stress UspA family protein
MNILLATDGSDSAKAAAQFIQHFPFPKDSELTVLTVIDENLVVDRQASELDEETRSALQDAERSVYHEAQQLLEAEAARLREAGWRASTAARTGHCAGEIIKAAEALGSDLIVLGSHGLGGIKSFLMGSVSHKLLHYAPCSVLIVKHPPIAAPAAQEAQQSWSILLAYDDSKPAKNAVRLCASLPLGETAQVTALTVLPLVKIYRQDIRQRLSPIWHQKKVAAQQALDQVVKGLHSATPQVSAQLRESPNVCQEILNAAAELDSDLIMLGDKGTGAFERFLLGSVTQRVARHAACSVWVVRN